MFKVEQFKTKFGETCVFKIPGLVKILDLELECYEWSSNKLWITAVVEIDNPVQVKVKIEAYGSDRHFKKKEDYAGYIKTVTDTDNLDWHLFTNLVLEAKC